jgi:hypothetical protein
MTIVTVYILFNFWGELQDWWLTVYTYYIILGCSGIVMGSWIAIDGKRLQRYSVKIKNLENKLNDLEKKIKLIKR